MSREQLFKFFEGKTSIQEEASIKLWMEESEENYRLFFQERKLYDSLNLMVKEEAYLPKTGINIHRIIIESLKIAATILVVVAISYLIQPNQKDQIVAYQTIQAPVGQRVNITLPDGTDVWLNAGTKFSYPTDFGHSIREVMLDGEAFFDVSAKDNQLFIVNTDAGSIEVLGTRFNVEAYSNSEIFETTLMQGKVKVSLNSDTQQYLYLQPNEKAIAKNGKLERVLVEDFSHYRWREGLICFKDATINEIMKDFEKYYDKKIIIRNTNILQYKFTGKFRQNDGIEYALRVLQKELQFRFEWNDDNQVIYID